jgi:hypothetical protein
VYAALSYEFLEMGPALSFYVADESGVLEMGPELSFMLLPL